VHPHRHEIQRHATSVGQRPQDLVQSLVAALHGLPVRDHGCHVQSIRQNVPPKLRHDQGGHAHQNLRHVPPLHLDPRHLARRLDGWNAQQLQLRRVQRQPKTRLLAVAGIFQQQTTRQHGHLRQESAGTTKGRQEIAIGCARRPLAQTRHDGEQRALLPAKDQRPPHNRQPKCCIVPQLARLKHGRRPTAQRGHGRHDGSGSQIIQQ
jgi:hypothetical protein